MKRSKQSLLHKELLGAAWNVYMCVLYALEAKTPSAQRGLRTEQSPLRGFVTFSEVGRQVPDWKQWIDK